MYMYSQTSNKGPSEKGTTYLQRHFHSNIPNCVHVHVHVYMQYIFNFQKEDNLPTRNKMAGPKVSFAWRFHCIPIGYTLHVHIYSLLYCICI